MSNTSGYNEMRTLKGFAPYQAITSCGQLPALSQPYRRTPKQEGTFLPACSQKTAAATILRLDETD